MAKKTINIGTTANDGTGDTLRVSFDAINDNFTELYDGAGAPEGTAILSTGEASGSKFLREDGDGTSSWQAISGGGDALTASPLSQFAATTSAQLRGVLSDETGTGAAVFATSPTLTTPSLGVATATSINGATITSGTLNGSVTGTNTGDQDLSGKQDTLVSGTNIKTINSTSLLGAGNIVIAAGTPEGTAVLSTGETVGKVLQADGDGTSSWVTLGGGGDALVANPLSQFAATTSLELKNTISDETGSGALVFATSPTLVTPVLGTPASGTLTNATGLPIVAGTTGTLTVARGGTGAATLTGIVKASGTSAFTAVTAPTGALVGTTDAQTLTNKTLTSPLINTPTGIVKADVGLGNVDNTSDVNKPVSTAQQTALNLKANLASPTFTGTVSGITKAMVGLTNVDDTSDATKNAATATLTNKRITMRVQSVTSSATVTPSADNDDCVKITAQAAALTLANPSGTATSMQPMTIRIKDNGTARAITFGANYRAIGITLPTTTVISKTIYLGMMYNSDDTKWDVVGYSLEA